MLGPGPHVSVHGIPKGDWRSEDTHQEKSLLGLGISAKTGDISMPGTGRMTMCTQAPGTSLGLRTFRTQNASIQCSLDNTLQGHFPDVSRPGYTLHSYSLNHVLHINSHFKISIILTHNIYELTAVCVLKCVKINTSKHNNH